MNKAEFLSRLNLRLSQLPESERKKHIDYYSELIMDMVESGMTEEEATSKLGDPARLATDILTDCPLPLLVKTKVKPRGGWTALTIILAVLAFPLWFPIALSLFGAGLCIYICLWAVILCVAFGVLGLIIGGLALTAASVCAIAAAPWTSVFFIGIGLGSIGVGILFVFGVYYLAVGVGKLSKLIARGIKSLFIRKDKSETK